LVAFVFWNGVFRRNVKSIALAGVVLFYYGSMFAGILPGQEGISWESHLLGAGAGIIVSFAYKKRMERDEVRPELPPEEAPRYFLDRDIFNQRRG
jgi:membrane associated rhomboid family serine protease